MCEYILKHWRYHWSDAQKWYEWLKWCENLNSLFTSVYLDWQSNFGENFENFESYSECSESHSTHVQGCFEVIF